METIITIITYLYAITGIISIIGYLPTIRDLTKNVASANLNSYVIWTFCTAIAFLYALLVISDLLLEIMIGLNLVCCIAITMLALKVKYKV